MGYWYGHHACSADSEGLGEVCSLCLCGVYYCVLRPFVYKRDTLKWHMNEALIRRIRGSKANGDEFTDVKKTSMGAFRLSIALACPCALQWVGFEMVPKTGTVTGDFPAALSSNCM